MRADFQIDGFGFAFCTVGGLDATDAVISLIKRINRPDINIILLSGTVIALFNVIDLHEVYRVIKKPIIAISYEPSEGIDEYLLQMPDGQKRIEILRKNGPRVKIILKNGLDVYIRPIGVDILTSINVLNHFIINGRYPEPIRTSKLLARSLYYFLLNSNLM